MRATAKTTRIALYGTLRQGQPPYRRLGLEKLLTYVGPCTITGTLHNFREWPGLVEGGGEVVGELFEVKNAEVMARLDAYEGYNPARPATGLFLRKLVTLVSPARVRAHVYFYNRDPGDAPVIESGDWVRHRMNRAIASSQ